MCTKKNDSIKQEIHGMLQPCHKHNLLLNSSSNTIVVLWRRDTLKLIIVGNNWLKSIVADIQYGLYIKRGGFTD